MLSENASVMQSQERYTLADFMIAIGGLSRTVYFIGMFAAHFVAQMLYKKALIQDMFLWQKKDRNMYASTRCNQKSISVKDFKPCRENKKLKNYKEDNADLEEFP